MDQEIREAIKSKMLEKLKLPHDAHTYDAARVLIDMSALALLCLLLYL